MTFLNRRAQTLAASVAALALGCASPSDRTTGDRSVAALVTDDDDSVSFVSSGSQSSPTKVPATRVRMKSDALLHIAKPSTSSGAAKTETAIERVRKWLSAAGPSKRRISVQFEGASPDTAAWRSLDPIARKTAMDAFETTNASARNTVAEMAVSKGVKVIGQLHLINSVELEGDTASLLAVISDPLVVSGTIAESSDGGDKIGIAGFQRRIDTNTWVPILNGYTAATGNRTTAGSHVRLAILERTTATSGNWPAVNRPVFLTGLGGPSRFVGQFYCTGSV